LSAEMAEEAPSPQITTSTNATAQIIVNSSALDNGIQQIPSNARLSVTPPSDDPTKLFVGQIPKTMTEDELRQVFCVCGTIIDANVIRDRQTSQSKGAAFVTFSSKQEADLAIATLHNKTILAPAKYPLQVQFADSEAGKLQTKLFLGMLPNTATEDDIQRLFLPFGEIEEVKLMRNPQGQSKCSAFLKYKTRSDAIIAINSLNGYSMTVNGVTNQIAVRFADTEAQKAKHAGNSQNQSFQADLLARLYAGGNPYSAYINPYAAVGYQNPYQQATPSASSATTVDAAMFQRQLTSMLTPSMMAPSFNATPQREGPPGANLFIYHLPTSYSDQDLTSVFGQFGTVVSAHVFIDKPTGQSKGFGFVSFDNANSAQMAIQSMNGLQVGDKRLQVQLKRGSTQMGGARSSPY